MQIILNPNSASVVWHPNKRNLDDQSQKSVYSGAIESTTTLTIYQCDVCDAKLQMRGCIPGK